MSQASKFMDAVWDVLECEGPLFEGWEKSLDRIKEKVPFSSGDGVCYAGFRSKKLPRTGCRVSGVSSSLSCSQTNPPSVAL